MRLSIIILPSIFLEKKMKIKVAIAQIKPTLGNVNANMQIAERTIERLTIRELQRIVERERRPDGK